MTYAVPGRHGTPFREPGDGPMEPFVTAAADRPIDWFEECIHCGACSMQHERHFGRFDSIESLAEALMCGEECDSYES